MQALLFYYDFMEVFFMNEIKIFNNDEFGQIRTVTINNEPMFCLADVCKSLEISHVTDVKNRLK